jgi:hypothetical protein
MSNKNLDFNPDDQKPQEAKDLDVERAGISLFFNPEKEGVFFENAGREITNRILQESFLLFRINYQKTRTHSLYGESKKKEWDAPVKIYGRINVEVQDPSYLGPSGPMRKGFGQITAHVYLSHIKELNTEVRVGDYMYHKGNYYEIIDDGSANISNQHAWGGDKQFYLTIKGVEVNSDVFKAR